MMCTDKDQIDGKNNQHDRDVADIEQRHDIVVGRRGDVESIGREIIDTQHKYDHHNTLRDSLNPEKIDDQPQQADDTRQEKE